MVTVAECLAAVEAEQQKRAARAERVDRYARFYKSAAWAKAKYSYLRSLPAPARCLVCGVTAADARLVVDHVVPLKQDFSRRLDPTNFQILCNEHNYICKGSQDHDWRTNKVEAVS